jgi:HNH endonuclease
MNPFVYPAQPHQRRHGPLGYANYESYRDWLRDEFSFRCVYCLNREQWVIAKGAFAIDHFVPTSINPARIADYDNLLYACVACNLTRGKQLIPDPLEHLLDSTVELQADGILLARTPRAQEIVEAIHLNDREYVFRRRQMISLFEELEKRRPDLHAIWLGLPDDLPDLSRLRPPGGNERPSGIDQSHFARRTRGELPAGY